jgi:hypothetical protein
MADGKGDPFKSIPLGYKAVTSVKLTLSYVLKEGKAVM